MLLPVIYSHGVIDNGGYWKYYFPSFIVASFFGASAFSGIRSVRPSRHGGWGEFADSAFFLISVSVMSSVPSDMSGVAGALLQVFLQVSHPSSHLVITPYHGCP